MNERYTQKDAQAAMERLAKALGKPYTESDGVVWALEGYTFTADGNYHVDGHLWDRVDGRNVAYMGAWHLDYAPAYGGFVVAEIINEGGGESRPLGDRRRSAREFCEAVRFALDALRLREAVAV